MVEVLSFPCLAYCVEGYLVVAPAFPCGLHRLADFHSFGELGDECVDVGPDRSVWVEREGDGFHLLLPFVSRRKVTQNPFHRQRLGRNFPFQPLSPVFHTP